VALLVSEPVCTVALTVYGQFILFRQTESLPELTSADDCEEDVVVEVLANGREINDNRNIDARQQSWVTNTRNLQNLRSVDRASGKNNFLLSLDCLSLTVSACCKLLKWSVEKYTHKHSEEYLDSNSPDGLAALLGENTGNLVAR
jgi:hypothetical protein